MNVCVCILKIVYCMRDSNKYIERRLSYDTIFPVARIRSSAVRLLIVSAPLILLTNLREMTINDNPHVHVNCCEIRNRKDESRISDPAKRYFEYERTLINSHCTSTYQPK